MSELRVESNNYEDDIIDEVTDEILDEDSNDINFVDEGLEGDVDESVNIPGVGEKSGRRGPDLPWELYENFNTIDEFKGSDVFKELGDYTRRSGKATSTETFVCKFSRKKGYLNCESKIRVIYSETSDEVTVEKVQNHNHQKDDEYIAGGQKENYMKWTSAQIKVVMTGVMNEASPTVIRRNLKEHFSEVMMPSAIQLSNKIAHCKTIINQTKEILTTGDLKDIIKDKLDTPIENTKMFVTESEVIDDEGEENVRFTIIFTTLAMQARLSRELIQDDATYRLNWMGFPVFISGRCSSTGRFFPTHVTLQSHEDTRAYSNVFKYVKKHIGVPSKRLADAAKEITAAGKEVFGEHGDRLMCYPHVHRNIEPKIKTLKKQSDNQLIGKQVLEDIETFQWIVTKKSFEIDFQALEDKYLKNSSYNNKEKAALISFFCYLRKQWGPGSPVYLWFEHGNPWSVSHNQSLKGKNTDIKRNHTFKVRVPLGRMIQILERMLCEFSEDNDSQLYEDRLKSLSRKDLKDGQGKTNLSRLTDGWKWAHENRKGTPNKVVRIAKSTQNYITISEENNMGEVDQLFAVNTKNGVSDLISKAKAKLSERSNPSGKSWDEKKKILAGCYLIEERDGDYWCDCFEGIKGRI